MNPPVRISRLNVGTFTPWLNQRCRVGALLALLALCGPVVQAQTVARWIGGDGSWTDPAQWDVGVVPNNTGANTYVAVVDAVGAGPVVTVTSTITVSGMVCGGAVRVGAGGTLNLNGGVTNRGTLAANGGALKFAANAVDNAGGQVIAEGSAVALAGSQISGGVLRVSDLAASLVRFSGDVTLQGVTWDDPGAGEFQIHNATARLLGDFAGQLPAGHTLVVYAQNTASAVQWLMPAGAFTNAGRIEVRHEGNGWTGYPRLHWETSGSLTGDGEVYLSGAGDSRSRPLLTGSTNALVTIGTDHWVHGRGAIQVALLNLGTVEADQAARTLALEAAFENQGTLRSLNGATLSVTAPLLNAGTCTAAGGNVQVLDTTVDNAGRALVAEGALLQFTDSAIHGGVIRATDAAGSLVRFSGAVPLNGVTWEDPGAGEFQIYNTSAQLLGDFTTRLPAGHRLVVYSASTQNPVEWVMPEGAFTNLGVIELRHPGNGWVGYPQLRWEGPATLVGDGEIYLSGAGDSRSSAWLTGAPGTSLTIGPGQWVHGRGEIQVPVLNHGLIEADVSGRSLTFIEPVDNRGDLRAVGNGWLTFSGGVTNQGTLALSTGGDLTLHATVSLHADLVAPTNSVVQVDGATVDLQDQRLVADTGQVVITDSTVRNGTLAVTGSSASLMRFGGAVNFSDIAWEDPGAGEYQVYNTTLELQGDLARWLPAACTLVVYSRNTQEPPAVNLPEGVFTNQGMFELRHEGNGWAGYPRLHFAGPATLAGGGEVLISGYGDNTSRALITGATNASLTIGPSQWLHGRGEIQLPVVNLGAVEADVSGRVLLFSGGVENHGLLSSLPGATLTLAGGLVDEGDLSVQEGGQLTLNGAVSLHEDLISRSNSVVQIALADAQLHGHALVADQGIVLLADCTASHGLLRATDRSRSLVRFSGDVVLNDVVWDDAGAGEFQVYNTSARLLGDYAAHLPSGYTLVVYSRNTQSAVSLLMPAGEFVNDGRIELRHEGNGWAGYPRLHWDAPGTLSGTGEVWLGTYGDNSSNALLTGAEGVEVTIGTGQRVHGRGEIRLDLVNHGTVEADVAGKTLRVTGEVRNDGTLGATTNATLVLQEDVFQDGLLRADGGVVQVNGSLVLGEHAVLETAGTGGVRFARHLTLDPGATNGVATLVALTANGAGTPAPDLSAAAFFVEAEDFNYDRGQHVPEADAMPYLGGGYAGLGGRDRIDYHQTDNAVTSDLYRAGEGPNFNVNVYAIAELNRGAYAVTNNFKVSDNDADDWYNYTRTFPASAGPSHFFARLASGGSANAVQVDEVTSGTTVTSQTLARLGEARGPASGDYSRFVFVPLRDASNNLVTFNWQGERTFRVTILPGGNEDLDYFVFAPAASSGPAQLLEAMGRDLGASGAGFTGNFALTSLTLTANTQVQLVDRVDNAAGTGAESLYVDSLVVPAGATLDLNGLKVYARTIDIDGAVIGGTVTQVSAEAPELAIQAAAGGVELSWPEAAAGFTLEWTGVLGSTNWTAVTDPPVVAGGRQTLLQPAAAAARYYRLRAP